MSTAINAEKFLPAITETCLKYDISTSVRQLAFLAQAGHESGGLFYTEELASGKAYEGRKDLGNTHAGDGVKYKGRGIIQITGRANYTALAHDLGADFVNNPSLLGGKNIKLCSPEQLRYAALSAGWFWHTHKLNDYADRLVINKPIDDGANLKAYKEITSRINGGYNGLQDRVVRYKSGLPCFLHI
jgi:putative chitinase